MHHWAVGRPPDKRAWLEDVARRTQLIRPAQRAYPDLTMRREQVQGADAGVVYKVGVTVPVEGYPDRHVTIKFHSAQPDVPNVFADGPNESPHRYHGALGTGRSPLCLWLPGDGENRRWVPNDGLLHLLAIVILHLFNEAWWRETGVWLGEQAPHPPRKKDRPA